MPPRKITETGGAAPGKAPWLCAASAIPGWNAPTAAPDERAADKTPPVDSGSCSVVRQKRAKRLGEAAVDAHDRVISLSAVHNSRELIAKTLREGQH